MNQDKSISFVGHVLNILWSIGISTAVLIISAIFTIGIDKLEKIAPLIGAFAILISAGIASASVMKNIAETKANEAKKHAKEDSKFYLDKSIQYLARACELLKNRPRDFMPWREASSLLLITKSISKNITEKSHKEIFKAESSGYSSKLFESIVKDQKESYLPITPNYFCLDIDVECSLKTAFENSIVKMNPMFIIPIFDFIEIKNNTFFENESDYENWKQLDLTRNKDSLLLLCAIDYINLYKESEITKE